MEANARPALDLWIGIDVGSVTAKIAVLDARTRALRYSDYARHNAEQAVTARRLLEDAHRRFPHLRAGVAVCGSGGDVIAAETGAFFVQEVVANAVAVRELYPRSRVAIELGGQDAKVVFFTHDDETGELIASDMRMNGSCAGGTGAFIDQMAELLGVQIDAFDELARKGERVYDVSGRCGVFAKTDIQPLLNQCAAKEDLALSVFHALAKQTIGGLVQGMTITPPVLFEGGPLTFNRRLIDVFVERLGLEPDQVIIPDRPELVVARGAALSIGTLFADKRCEYDEARLSRLDGGARRTSVIDFYSLPFFASDDERRAFEQRHAAPRFAPREIGSGTTLPVYLGIDAGSTTSKFVLLDEDGALVDRFYANNKGEPLGVVQRALLEMRERYRDKGVTLDIRGVGTTGYGEQLFASAFKADFHTVETVAHAEAAMAVDPRVSFILDIGGQDMKAIRVGDGIVHGITLNEACSAGCGSFVETFARNLGVAVEDIAAAAFSSQKPSRLGSRCTVFMNSSVITEQKNGSTPADILAGITRSIVDNVFTKVVRVANFSSLGDVVFAQGGTFKNDAVLRSFEQYTGCKVIRPPHPGEMGAIGIALLTKKHVRAREQESGARHTTSFIGLDALDAFCFEKLGVDVCPFCTNSCKRSRIRFSDGSEFVTGNRCERGEVFGDPKDKEVLVKVRAAHTRMNEVPDLVKLRESLLFKSYEAPLVVEAKRNVTIGIPRVLELWNSMPFWTTLFRSLGFDVAISKKSDTKLFEAGLPSVPSDTICFPAKLAHGHVKDLIAKKVDRIFMPMMIKMPAECGAGAGSHSCAVVQGYPLVVDETEEPERLHGIPFDRPVFHWTTRALRDRQLRDGFRTRYAIGPKELGRAIAAADAAVAEMKRALTDERAKVLASLEGSDRFAVVLCGRPYHDDPLISHDLSRHFTRQGIPVLTVDSMPDATAADLKKARAEIVNPLHTRMFSAALHGGRHPNLELAQVVSFGCGHDAVITDEMQRLLTAMGEKQLLVLKLDEGEARGPLAIRVTSFIETVRARRRRQRAQGADPVVRELPPPFSPVFGKRERKERTVLAPNLSRGFAEIFTAASKRFGVKVEPLPLADARAIELGKKYVHNDICFPAQVNVGEFLALMEKGEHDPSTVALGLAKNCDDCRAGQYAALARKALDEAGFHDVPILTTGNDTKGMHPGFGMGPREQTIVLWGMALMDALDDMLRKCRPYERTPGQIDALHEEQWGHVLKGLSHSNKRALQAFEGAVDAFNTAPLARHERKPRIGVVGEILLNYHPTANGQLVRYLEKHGMEVHVPGMVDFFRRDLIRIKEGVRRNHLTSSVLQAVVAGVGEKLYQHVTSNVERVHARFRFHEKHANCHELRRHIEDIIDPTYMVGEGWLMPAEIIEAYQHGVRGFVIVQPFGCMPNHITGRGIMKTLKRRCPSAQIVSLDYDPDISFANIENRLMMLIMSVRDLMRDGAVARRSRGLPVLDDDVIRPEIQPLQPVSLAPAAVAELVGHEERDEGDAGTAE